MWLVSMDLFQGKDLCEQMAGEKGAKQALQYF